MQGQPSHETVHWKHPDGSPYPASECPMLRPREDGEPVHGEDEWFVRRDGSMVPIAWWSAPIEIASGRGAVFSFTDVTERRAAERAERERDAAEIRAAAARAAQRRIVESALQTRRQITRDLHDGAQQQLVNLLIGLRLAREELASDPAQTAALLDAAADQARAAIDELRELVTGIHPSLLATHGLRSAVESLATRAPLPVTVSGEVEGRLEEAVEAAAYFFVAEALTNAAKHAEATRVDVALGVADGVLTVEVRDDGVGGARLDGGGTGLAGLRDRVDALEGTFAVTSPPGGGTTLRAKLPLSPAGI